VDYFWVADGQHTGSSLPHIQTDQTSRIVFGTFGIYRYCLAVLVVVSHAGPKGLSYAGEYAVFAFYILSGYVVSYILHQKYLRIRRGVWWYFANRFLRIFPLYWAIFPLSLWLTILFPGETRDFMMLGGVPDSLSGWIENIATLGMVNPVTGNWQAPFVLQPAWSLGVEITYWIAMPWLLIHALLRRSLMAFAVIYLVPVLELSLRNEPLFYANINYLSALAASLPFSIGLALFLRKTRDAIVLSPRIGIGGISVFLVLLVSEPFLSSKAQVMGFYLSVGTNTLIVMLLAQINQDQLPAFWRKLDNLCGHVAYPLYLINVPIAVLLHVFVPALARDNWELCIGVIVFGTIAAYWAYQIVDVRVERFKRNERLA
jgi:peptidoglycan/LPS O-acetylase OafA/YrhL